MHLIVKARPLPGYRLALVFDDNVAGQVDLSDLVGSGVFERWRDPDEFARVSIDPVTGTVAWPGGIDLCPDQLYAEITGAAPLGPVYAST